MTNKNNNRISLNPVHIWGKTIGLIKKHPVILAPFIFIAFFDAFILMLLYLAPRPPLSVVIGPVIRAFWGDRFLHYPANFLLLPTLFNHARNMLGFIVGLIFTGMAVSFVHQTEKGFLPKWKNAFSRTMKRYVRLFVLWLIMLASFYIILKTFRSLVPIHSLKLKFTLEFVLNILIQTIFIFSIPSIVIENRKVYTSIIRSIAVAKNHLLTTLFIIAVPSMLVVPLTYIHIKLPILMSNFVPDITLYYLILRIIVLNIMDLCITVPAVVMLLEYRRVHHEKTLDE